MGRWNRIFFFSLSDAPISLKGLTGQLPQFFGFFRFFELISSKFKLQTMDCSVVSVQGKPTSLISLWKKRKIVLCFLRQLGCRFCMERTKNLMSIQSNLTKENIKLVLVSLGTPMQAIKFIERTGFQGELLLLLLLLFLLFFVWLVIIL